MRSGWSHRDFGRWFAADSIQGLADGSQFHAVVYTLSCVPIRNKFSRHPVGCFCCALSRLTLYLWRRTAMRLTALRAINRRPFCTALRFEQNEQGASQAYRDGV